MRFDMLVLDRKERRGDVVNEVFVRDVYLVLISLRSVLGRC